MRANTAFSIMEIIVVVVIIGIIASFSIPGYQNSVRKARERDAVDQLKMINAANQLYFSREGTYLPGTGLNADVISSAFDLNIVPNSMAYSYSRMTATTYQANAIWDEAGAPNDFTVRVNNNVIGVNNPCCRQGNCPTRPGC